MDPLAQSLKDLPKQPQLSDARLMDSADMHTPKKSKAKANTQPANPLAKPTAKPTAKPAAGTPTASTGAEAPSLVTSLNETQTVSLSSMAAVQPTPEKLAQQQTEAIHHQSRGERAVKLDTPADTAQKKLQAYAAAYLGVKKETKSTGTVQDQRSELLASGVSEGDLQELETGIATVAKTQLKHQMKHMARTQILTEFGSDGELDKQNAHALEHGIKQLRNQLKANGKVGGPDQIHDWHHEAVYEAMDEVADAIRVYRLETFKDFKTQELASDPAAPETEKQYEELGQLGFKLGAFDYKEAFKLTDQFTLDLYDLGSLLFESDMDMDQNPHTPTPYTYSQSDEHDILLDRLRAILMNVALTGGVLNQISSQFKIQKIKNGLVKLGVYNEDLLHTLTQETEAEAIQILTKILHECCLEHASFYRLSGIDYEQNKRKFKATVRNLNRLGVSISDTQLDQYQADANRAMYPAIVNAYRRAVVSGYDTQQHQLLQTASRLRTETPDLSAYTSPDMEGPLMALNHDQFSESV
jgi:hypothetical protein